MAEGTSVADDLSAAWDKLEGGEATEEAAPETEPEGQTAPEPDSEGQPAADNGQAPEAAEATHPPTEKAPVAPKPGKDGKASKTPGAKAPPAQAAPDAGPKAPQSWPVAVREHWKALPPEVKAQVDKTEREVRRVLQETAGARKVAAELEKTLTPYKPFMRGTPIQEIDGLFKTAALLRTGDDETRAAIAANILTNFRVPLKRLAEILGATGAPTGEGEETQPPPRAAPQPQPQDLRDPRFDQFMGTLQQRAQAAKEARKQRHLAELKSFAESGKAEFFYDVMPQMEIVQAAAQRDGEELSVEELYERACILNKSVRPLWEQRRAATHAAANASRASTQPRTRVASSSVRHEPTAPATGKRELTRREELEANWDRLAAKR